MAHREPPAIGSRELRAAGLAALAESCVLYLPVRGVLAQAADPLPLATAALPFALAYVGGTLLACIFRTSRALASGAVGAALLAGLGIGGGGGTRIAAVALMTLLIAVRVVALGVRDWRIPIGAELPVGAAVLGVQVVIAAAARPDWTPLLAVLVPLFFAASLASRASAVWASSSAGDLDPTVRRSWFGASVAGTSAVLAGAVALAFLFLHGGVLARAGAWLAPVWDVVVVAIVTVVAFAARPLFWLVERLGADPDALRELLEGLRGPEPTGAAGGGGGVELWQRLLAALVFALLGFAIYRVLKRFRPRPERAERPPPPLAGSWRAPAAGPSAPSRRPFRRELPADAVRRWYAEVLLALRWRELAKEPRLTPAEFVPVVTSAFPEAADDFRALTLAYEDVRYGNRRLGRRDLRSVEASRRRLLAMFRTRARHR